MHSEEYFLKAVMNNTKDLPSWVKKLGARWHWKIWNNNHWSWMCYGLILSFLYCHWQDLEKHIGLVFYVTLNHGTLNHVTLIFELGVCWFRKCLLSDYYMTGVVQGTLDSAVTEIKNKPCFMYRSPLFSTKIRSTYYTFINFLMRYQIG